MQLFHAHRGFWNERTRRSLFLGLVLLILALGVNRSATRLSYEHALHSSLVGDLFLDNIPVLNVDSLIVQGIIVFWVLASILLVLSPRHLLFALKAIALFVIVRAFFINLTHLGIYRYQTAFDVEGPLHDLYRFFTFQGDYFFSGHTGAPFLMALIFWENRFWRCVFLAAALFFAVVLLVGHAHYSIDIFAAPFITYGVFKITERFFPRDAALLTGKTAV